MNKKEVLQLQKDFIGYSENKKKKCEYVFFVRSIIIYLNRAIEIFNLYEYEYMNSTILDKTNYFYKILRLKLENIKKNEDYRFIDSTSYIFDKKNGIKTLYGHSKKLYDNRNLISSDFNFIYKEIDDLIILNNCVDFKYKVSGDFLILAFEELEVAEEYIKEENKRFEEHSPGYGMPDDVREALLEEEAKKWEEQREPLKKFDEVYAIEQIIKFNEIKPSEQEIKNNTDIQFDVIEKVNLSTEILYESYNESRKVLSFSNGKVILAKKGNDTDDIKLLEILLSDVKKTWYNDEIMEKFGYKSMREVKKNKFYFAKNTLNRKIKKDVGIDDFVTGTTKQFQINNTYLQ